MIFRGSLVISTVVAVGLTFAERAHAACSTTVHQETSATYSYGWQLWSQGQGGSQYSGGYAGANGQGYGGSANFTFTGDGVSWFSNGTGIPANGLGSADVYLDGAHVATVDLHNFTWTGPSQAVYSVSGLPSGQHTLRIVNKPYTYDGYSWYQWILIDRFEVTSGCAAATDAGTPGGAVDAGSSGGGASDAGSGGNFTCSGSVDVEEGAAGISYSNRWDVWSQGQGGSQYSGGFARANGQTSPTGGAVTFTFSGEGVSWFSNGTGIPSSGLGAADVYLDGAHVATVDLHNFTWTGPSQEVYSVAGLANGSHTLRIVNKAYTYDGYTWYQWILVDRFQVKSGCVPSGGGTNPPPSADAGSNPPPPAADAGSNPPSPATDAGVAENPPQGAPGAPNPPPGGSAPPSGEPPHGCSTTGATAALLDLAVVGWLLLRRARRQHGRTL
ncbi:MAG: hypothetical protein ACOZIN_16380 [Myxococcota bacterium]